ncbi:hypothetical protein T439DRAFT_307230 [Meredithblackwellia eburnea MCA 4105]
MAYNPNFNPRYGRGGGGGGGYGGGGYGGGGRKRGRDDDGDSGGYYNNNRRRNNERGDYYSSPRRDYRNGGVGGGYNNGPGQGFNQKRFKDDVWKLGSAEQQDDYDPVNELPILANSVRTQFLEDKKLVFETFRVAVTELPHKIPHYVALITYLSMSDSTPAPTLAARLAAVPSLPPKPTTTTEGTEGDAEMKDKEEDEIKPEVAAPEVINIGREIIKDLTVALQEQLDDRRWRGARYIVHLLSFLTSLPDPSHPIVDPFSLLVLLRTFTSALSDPGIRAGRGDECVRIVVESVLRLGYEYNDPVLDELKDELKKYMAARIVDREVFGGDLAVDLEDRLRILIETSDAPVKLDIFPSLYDQLPTPLSKEGQENLPPLVVPIVTLPSAELDLISNLQNKGPTIKSSGLKGDEGVGYEGVRLYLRLFSDDTVPTKYDGSGEVLRSLIFDIIDLYEINRKECASILLDLPKWFKKGTFRGRDDGEIDEEARQWSLENLIVESILTSLFALPNPRLPSSYYHSVLTELCRLSPQTIAPSLGKCVRRLYSSLGEEERGIPYLDAEGVRRFAEWFSVHLSNFGFMWGWADWVADMDIVAKHPKRVFVERVIELEVRLSYYDRVKGTIPAAMLETGVMESDGPGPSYSYESETHSHSAAAAALLSLMRSKASVTDVDGELSSFQTALMSENGLTEEAAEAVKRDMAVETLLQVGSRSFSHFLNVLERYLALLRSLTPSEASRVELINTVARFWKRNAQFRLIVIDKLLQYRLLDPTDIVAWVFEKDAEGNAKSWSDLDLWATLENVLKTVRARAKSAKAKLENLESESAKKKMLEAGDDAIIVDDDNADLSAASTQLDNAEQDLTKTVVEVVKKFDELLSAPDKKSNWESWWFEGWFRELARSLAKDLISKPSIVDGIEQLQLEPDSITVSLLDSAKAWNELN